MLTSRESPFRYGCIVQDRFFCPRPLLERELTRFIRSGQNVVIQGERRMGKSSLVYETVSKMRGFRLLYVDLLNVGSVDGFCRRVLSAIKALDARSGLLRKALALIPRLRPVLSIDPASGETSFSLEFRRQVICIVSSGNDIDIARLLLHPREEVAEHTSQNLAVATTNTREVALST